MLFHPHPTRPRYRGPVIQSAQETVEATDDAEVTQKIVALIDTRAIR